MNIPSQNPQSQNTSPVDGMPQPAPPSEPDQWLDSRFTLRTELKYDARSQNKTSFVVIEDPVRSKYFQIGAKEYQFIRSIDGNRTPRQIMDSLNSSDSNNSNESTTNRRSMADDHRFTEETVTKICQWLVQSNLVFGESIDNAKRLNQQAMALRRSKLIGLINPISCKFKLFNPNSVLTKIQPSTEWIFSFWFLCIWILVATYAMTKMFGHWDQMGAASCGILSGYSWIWLLITWVGLKVVHEAAHGIACRRYGGEVPEAGVLLLLFTPMAYVNVTSMWRFPNRWHRMVVAGAGMYIELFISFLALILWTRSTGVVADVSFNVFLMSSVTTILFNANPLMRFDGYFLLSDLMGIPNLYPKGTKWFGDRLKHVFFGVPKTPNICSASELRRVAIYGSMAFFWKISISVSLIIGAGVLFHGLGLILSLFGIGLWFGMPIYGQMKTLFGPNAPHKIKPIRVMVNCLLLLAFGVTMFWVLKAPATKSAPAIVQFANETLLRANADGFVEEILILDGNPVQEGQELMVLKNPQLENQVVELERLAHEAKIQYRIYTKQNELSLAMAELNKHQELNEQLAEKREEAKGLLVIAPFDGFVFQRGLENEIGNFAKRGDPLLSIAQRQTKEVVVSIDQRDLESIKGNEGDLLRVALPGLTVFNSRLVRVDPRASETPSHPSLCAQAGGPLDVRRASASGDADQPRFELLSPRFNVVLELDSDVSQRLNSGQRGRAFFSTCEQSLGSYFYLAASDWLKSKIEIATQTAVF